MVKVLLTLIITAIVATASPMRVIRGGSTFATDIPPSHPSTAGKRVPPSYMHLVQGDHSLSNDGHRRGDVAKANSIVNKEVGDEAPSQDESGSDSSYHPTSSAPSHSSQDYGFEERTKRHKASIESMPRIANVQHRKDKDEDSSKEAASSTTAVTFIPGESSTPGAPSTRKRGRPQTREESEKMRRIRMNNRNYRHRQAGQPQEFLSLPPSHPLSEVHRQRKEMEQRAVAEHTDRIEEITAERDVAVLAFGKLSKEERSNAEILNRHIREQTERQEALAWHRKEKNRILRKAKVAITRQKKRMEQGLPLRSIGRPRLPDRTPKQLKASLQRRKYYLQATQGKEASQKTSNTEPLKANESHEGEGPSSSQKAGLGQISWSGKRRGPRIQRENYEGWTVSDGSVPVNGAVHRDCLVRRPREPPSLDPYIQWRRVTDRNKFAAKYGRPLEPVPPKPARKLKIRIKD